MNWDEYYAWVQQGIDRGWISKPYCCTHEDPYIEEFEDWEQYLDYCIPVVRLIAQEKIID